ncbi:flavin reductase family protein [Streptomyces sp. NPDC054919]
MALPRLRTVLLVTGAALLAKRALHRRIEKSPLWPLPALEEPVSGHSGRRSTTTRRLLIAERTAPADGVVQLRLEGPDLPTWQPGAHLDLPHVSYSCEQGFCGTCQQRVLEGEMDHRDELVTDAERDDSMLICVSRCRGERLVLDL